MQVKEILDKEPNFLKNKQDHAGKSILMYASQTGNIKLIKLLMSYQPNLNLRDVFYIKKILKIILFNFLGEWEHCFTSGYFS